MAAISSINTALALLRSGSAAPNPTRSVFPASTASRAGSGGILDAIKDVLTGNADLRAQFDAFYRNARQNSPLIHDDNARHIALVETISANRGAFPPGEFSIRTELPDGASITTFIPAADGTMTDHRHAAALKGNLQQVAASDSPAKLNAMARIAEVVALNTRVLDAAPRQRFEHFENARA